MSLFQELYGLQWPQGGPQGSGQPMLPGVQKDLPAQQLSPMGMSPLHSPGGTPHSSGVPPSNPAPKMPGQHGAVRINPSRRQEYEAYVQRRLQIMNQQPKPAATSVVPGVSVSQFTSLSWYSPLSHEFTRHICVCTTWDVSTVAVMLKKEHYFLIASNHSTSC